jgi:hypothetical protein
MIGSVRSKITEEKEEGLDGKSHVPDKNYKT